MSKDYFVVLFKSASDEEVFYFPTEKGLFEWLQDHKNDKITVFEANCILDWS